MCSISGIVGGGGASSIEKMVKTQAHRAPDDKGFYKDKHVELGMGRLSIIDLVSSGLCPYQEDHFVLTYNGEIYNYIELRKELRKLGWRFKTKSDTEVLLKSWRQWGLKMFDKLNGMYAFAIYDTRRKKLILARDIAGEKPLYFYSRGNKFIFSSEAKAITDVVHVREQDDIFFNAFQHCHGTTLWKGVNQLPPAHYMIYDVRKKTYKVKPHWEFKPRNINLRYASEELEDLLEDSVRLRTRSDVPYGLYFSGGIDSSLISTFHDFKQKFYFDHSKDWKEDFFNKVENIAWHLDFPVGSLSSYPLWNLAERASKEVKVILSGEGADEIFGGYVRYMPIAHEWELRQDFPSYNYLFGKYFPNHLEGFTKITARNDNIEFVREQLRPYFDMFDDPISAMGFADFKLIMPSLLQMGDRMAGAWGIENRCPFLDRRVIEFGFSLPANFKVKSPEQKVILRKILTRRGLLEPLWIEKKGLTILFNSWFEKKDWDRSMYVDLLRDKWRKKYRL